MSTLDPVEYAILSQSIIAGAREMGAKLIRSAYSTILREARDGSAALLDAAGNTVAQAELIPMQLGSIGRVFEACRVMFPPETLEEDDFLVINDPYSGGQHLQDVFFFHPIFFEGTVIGFSASVAHHLDIGGGNPGLNTLAADVYAEGIIIPPMKVNAKRDWYGADGPGGSLPGPFQRMLRANVRVPQQTMGDFDAQIAANKVGALRIQELATRYGVGKVLATMAALQDYSETRMRAAIAAAPDGVYHGEAMIDDDGITDDPIIVKSTVTIHGDSMTVDYTGTSKQVRTTMNSPFAACISASMSAVKSVLTSPDIPFNDGSLRPVTVIAPKGCLLNPHHPAPVRARMEAASRAFNATMSALSQAVPGQVIATGYDTTTAFCLSRLDEEKGWSVYLEVFGGGYGAGLGKDGCDAVDNPLSNCSNTPAEAMDQDFDFFRITEYALRPDSCGAGASRGGVGFRRSYEVLRDGTKLSFYSDRFRRPAEGLFGGTAGGTGFVEVLRGGQKITLKSKDTMELRKHDIVTFGAGGGGGYGEPGKRSAEQLADDVADGIITEARAARWAHASAAE